MLNSSFSERDGSRNRIAPIVHLASILVCVSSFVRVVLFLQSIHEIQTTPGNIGGIFSWVYFSIW
jgi:hypothetical protein